MYGIKNINRKFCVLVLLLIMMPFGLSAQFSLGTEIGLPGTVGIAAGYEKKWFRSELVGHVFVLDYVTALFTEDGFSHIHEDPIIGKGILSAKFTPWKRHALYGGVGLIGYFDIYRGEYML